MSRSRFVSVSSSRRSRRRAPAIALGLLALLVLVWPAVAFADVAPEPAASEFWQQGWLWMYLGAFGAGFLTSLTPCVYPMIPIVVGVFGARDDSVTRREAFLLATLYVLGMGVMYSSLGVVFALLGQQFGTILANPWVVIPMVVFYAALAASMFGFWEIRLPMSWQARLNKVGGRGYGGAFGMGLVGGITAAPCTGPVLAGILAGVTQTRDAVAGSTLLFTYAIGMGVLFWIIAAFAVSLPKSGRWMEAVKSVGGIALLAAGIYFLRPIVPAIGELSDPGLVFLLASLAVAAAGVVIGGVHLSFHGPWSARLRKGAGIALAVAGVSGAVNWALTPDRVLPWIKGDEAAAFAQAQAEGKGVMIDFGAEWCAPCKVLENTFGEEDVFEAITARFVPLKFDVTEPTDANFDRQEKWGAPELPAVVFVAPNGEVIRRYKEKDPSTSGFMAALKQATAALDATAGTAAPVAISGQSGGAGVPGAGAGGDASVAVPIQAAGRDAVQAEPEPRRIAWHTDDQTALAAARSQGKPVFIDFTATWCAPCQEMEAETFSDAKVAALLSEHYVPVRIDLTEGTDAQAALSKKYGADNLPLMLVLDSQGREQRRFHKFVAADELLAQLTIER